jgi:hypothetical protein
MTRPTFIFACAMLALAPAAFGQYNSNACGPHTTAGTYVVSCSGFITPGPQFQSLPVTILGTVVGDNAGSFSGSALNSVAGSFTPAPVSGQANTASDCTGTITYNKGTPGELNVKYVILANGDEMRGMVTDRGSNVACTLTRIRR